MSRSQVRTLVAVLALVLVLGLPGAAHALTLRQGDAVTIAAGETVHDDVYAFGGTIQIDGTVEGDVITAGQSVVIGGRVDGSVFAAAQTVRVTGEVGGSVRAAGSDVSVDGVVAGDVLGAGATVRLGSDARVRRDAALAAGTVTVLGEVGRNGMLSGSTISVQAPIGGDLQASGDRITIGSSGSVGGDFEYWSDAKPAVAGDVSGQTIAHAAQRPRQDRSDTFVSSVLTWIRATIGWILFALLSILVLPVLFGRSSDVLTARPWPSLGIGALAFFVTPVAAIPIFIVTLIVGGWWIVVLLMAMWWLLLSAGFITASLCTGRLVLSRMSSRAADVLAVLVGLAILRIVGAVPLLGGLVAFGATLFGTGALLMILWDAVRGQRGGTRLASAGPAVPVTAQPAYAPAYPTTAPATYPTTAPAYVPPAQPTYGPPEAPAYAPEAPPSVPPQAPPAYAPPPQAPPAAPPEPPLSAPPEG